MDLLTLLQQEFRHALKNLVADPEPYLAMIKPTQDPKHGDYQANCAMSLAKKLDKKPRDVAQHIIDHLDLGAFLEKPEIAGPGFINLRLNDSWIAHRLQEMAKSSWLGVDPAKPPKTFVIDFSSPNVAKPMHVGHLRSTIIGDSLSRLLRFLGHQVVADNHLGDWGTQFGIILYGYKNFRDEKALAADPVRELARLYVHVRSLMKGEEDEENASDPVGDACRLETAKLHAGDSENLRLWKMFMPWCMEEIERIYRRLDVKFDHTLGESFYQPMLAEVVKDLLAKGIALESQGAVVIFFGEKESPALIQKKDGAFTYTTTDLATIKYRGETWKPNAVLYVVDFRQSLHFKNLFDAARRWGFDKVELAHIAFGSVLSREGKPIKTREGGAVELGALLEEAVQRAAKVYEENILESQERSEDLILGEEEKRQIYEVVGIGAVKYADLCQNRTTDYKFDFEKMLAMNGNTATYMQYAYARNRSIFRRGNEEVDRFRKQPPVPYLESVFERALAMQLLRLEENLVSAAAEYQPSVITSYLWDLAKAYSGFFQNCPVLKAETPMLRESRLLLCEEGSSANENLAYSFRSAPPSEPSPSRMPYADEPFSTLTSDNQETSFLASLIDWLQNLIPEDAQEEPALSVEETQEAVPAPSEETPAADPGQDPLRMPMVSADHHHHDYPSCPYIHGHPRGCPTFPHPAYHFMRSTPPQVETIPMNQKEESQPANPNNNPSTDPNTNRIRGSVNP